MRALWDAGLFFFQAEDGIRDYKVTGVQTCALPISFEQFRSRVHDFFVRELVPALERGEIVCVVSHKYVVELICRRSEERRVGKEWRAARWPARGAERSAGWRSSGVCWRALAL